jgi:hypothetical protein
MEILINCTEGESLQNRQKKFTPVYIPVDVVNRLYRFNTKELLKLLFDHMSFSKNSSAKLDYKKLRAYLESLRQKNAKNPEFVTPESGVITTSYMFQECDYNVTIKYPYLEYHNSYKNVVIIRPLIMEEDYNLFFKSLILLSTDWPSYALKCFTQYTQFNMFIAGKKAHPGLSQFSSPAKTLKVKESPLLNSPNKNENG